MTKGLLTAMHSSYITAIHNNCFILLKNNTPALFIHL